MGESNFEVLWPKRSVDDVSRTKVDDDGPHRVIERSPRATGAGWPRDVVLGPLDC